MAYHLKTRALRHKLIVGFLILERRIDHRTAPNAHHVVMRVAAQVESVGNRGRHLLNLAVVVEQVEVAVHRCTADLGVALVNVVVNLLRRGMIAMLAHDLQHQAALLGVALNGSALFRRSIFVSHRAHPLTRFNNRVHGPRSQASQSCIRAALRSSQKAPRCPTRSAV